MRNLLGTNSILGYCTNVHAGVTLDEVLANLEQHAVQVQQKVCPDEQLGVGLWLAEPAARELLASGRVAYLRDWLTDHQLAPFTFNGFPYSNFHQPVVKHQVYLPDWSMHQRLDYTITLARIQAQLLPEGAQGSISTLPVGWPTPPCPHVDLPSAAAHLQQLAEELARIESQSGRSIHVAIEPEPGCLIATCSDLIRFYEEHLLAGDRNEQLIRRHIGACHDVCHTAVVFGEQDDDLARYQHAGITVSKVQLSNAIEIDWRRFSGEQRHDAIQQLTRFSEPRYLHQTTSRQLDASGTPTFQYFEDLPHALTQGAGSNQTWRVHFHMPLYVERVGLLDTTAGDLQRCLQWLIDHPEACSHFEAETYAWSVLPAPLLQPTLADGIAQELIWLRDQLQRMRQSSTNVEQQA